MGEHDDQRHVRRSGNWEPDKSFFHLVFTSYLFLSMASIRTQKEMRQRAPIWLVTLLFTNLVIMAVSAREPHTQQRMFRAWSQAIAAPVQSVTSKASGDRKSTR